MGSIIVENHMSLKDPLPLGRSRRINVSQLVVMRCAAERVPGSRIALAHAAALTC
jgi:hypothetical protein